VPEFVRSAALGSEQIIALKTRRRIPHRMMPEATGAGTVKVHLDGRWLVGVTPQPKASVRKKLDLWNHSPSHDGYAWRGSDRAVIGVPMATM
jgi:hypothetical protein